MNLKHYVYIKGKVKNQNRLLVKLYKNHINVYDIVKKNEEIYLKVTYEDYEKIKKNIVTDSFYYVGDSGIFKLKRAITPLKVIAVLCFLFFTNFFSQIIVKVEVIHSNKEIRELVSKALDQEGIRIWSLKKDYHTLKESKEKILAMYKDRLEWIEIESIGMKYVVRIEERIIKNVNDEEKYCHIVAKKSGIINNVTSTKGDILVHTDQYVKEGDILISGEIKMNEEIKGNVCASGNVYAEVWYESHVSLPIHYKTTEKTGKKRWNFSIETDSGKYKLLRGRLSNYETESKPLFHFFNFTFYLDIESEIREEENQYTLESGTKRAIELADQKIETNFLEKERIKLRKVLKNTLNDSTIEVDLFYAVIENISAVEQYSITMEKEGL